MALNESERDKLFHLVVLWGFAILQPTLSVLSDRIEFFFPLRRVDGWQFVVMLIVIAIVPPAAMWAVGRLVGRGRPRLRRALHSAAIGFLAAAFGAYLLRESARVGLIVTLVVALAAAAGFTWAYNRFGGLRTTLTVLIPAPAIFLILFLFFTNASHLVFPGGTDVPAAQTSKPTPVVLLVLDELPIASLMTTDEKIDTARFPNLANLADEATWYRSALSVSWTTFTAVPAILTGQHPDPKSLPVVSDHPENVFTLLRRTHAERVIESFTRLCPLVVCPNDASPVRRLAALASAMSLVYVNVVLPRKGGLRAPNPGNTWKAVLAALSPEREVDPFDYETGDLRLFPGPQFDRFLSLIERGGSRPPLYFLHANLPHNPYNHLPSGKLYRDHDKEMPGLDETTEEWSDDVDGVLHGWQRHLLQTQYADKLVGELMGKLRSTGIYDEALIVVVADHGAHFFAGRNRRKPEEGNLSDIAMVPLFVKAPRQAAGRVVDTPVSTLDVLPTIAQETGATLPWKVDGTALGTAAAGRKFQLLDEDDVWLTLDPAKLQRERAQVIALREGVLGHEGPGLFGIGLGRPLVGKDLASVPKGPAVPLEVELEDAEDYTRVDPASPYIPALVRGTLRGNRRNLTAVAAVVDGTIQGSSMIRHQDDGFGFSLMVPEAAFRPGPNEVRIVGISGQGTALRAHPLNG